MCSCQNKAKGDGENIALSFETNSPAIASVFLKYGMGKMEPTPQNALIGTVAHGAPFATDVALAAAGLNNSSYTAEEQAQQAGLAATIFQILGTAANTGINIAGGIAAIKNGNTPPVQQPVNNGNGQPQIVYMPQPTQPAAAPAKIAGFTTGQLALLGLALVAVIGVLVFYNKKP